VAAACIASAPVDAQTSCARESISARGEPASYRWLALIKARGNWRAKVRQMPALGADYANWSRAANSEERCTTGSSGIVCTLTGTPCKPS
jgi:hypothetical protein